MSTYALNRLLEKIFSIFSRNYYDYHSFLISFYLDPAYFGGMIFLHALYFRRLFNYNNEIYVSDNRSQRRESEYVMLKYNYFWICILYNKINKKLKVAETANVPDLGLDTGSSDVEIFVHNFVDLGTTQRFPKNTLGLGQLESYEN